MPQAMLLKAFSLTFFLPSVAFFIILNDSWLPSIDSSIPSDDSAISSSEWSPVILFLLLLIDSHIIHFHGLWEGVCVNTLNTPPCPANGDI